MVPTATQCFSIFLFTTSVVWPPQLILARIKKINNGHTPFVSTQDSNPDRTVQPVKPHEATVGQTSACKDTRLEIRTKLRSRIHFQHLSTTDRDPSDQSTEEYRIGTATMTWQRRND